MGSDLLHRLVLIVSLSLLFFVHSSEALCVPRNSTARSKIQNNPTVGEAAPPEVTTAPPPVTVTVTTPAASTPTIAPINVVPKATSIAGAIAKGVIDAAVTRVCQSTDYPGLCLSSLKPYLSGETDVVSLLHAEIQASKHHTAIACAKAASKSQDPTIDPQTASLLEDCKSSFDDALSSIKEAEEAMKTRDFGTVNTMLSAAMTGFGDCDDLLSQGTDGPGDSPDGPGDSPDAAQPADPGVSSVITKEDKTLKSLVSNCLAIASLLHH